MFLPQWVVVTCVFVSTGSRYWCAVIWAGISNWWFCLNRCWLFVFWVLQILVKKNKKIWVGTGHLWFLPEQVLVTCVFVWDGAGHLCFCLSWYWSPVVFLELILVTCFCLSWYWSPVFLSQQVLVTYVFVSTGTGPKCRCLMDPRASTPSVLSAPPPSSQLPSSNSSSRTTQIDS